MVALPEALRLLEHHVARMRADPRSRNLSERFLGQWLQLGRLGRISPDPKRFPGFTPSLAQAMRREAELFFLAVLREKRDARELLARPRLFGLGEFASLGASSRHARSLLVERPRHPPFGLCDAE